MRTARLLSVFALCAAAATAHAEDRRDGLQKTSDLIMWSNLGLTVVHHLDHPMRQHTGVLLYYPTLIIEPAQVAFQYFDVGPAVWIPFDTILVLLDLDGHFRNKDIDRVDGAYEHWAHGHNALDTHSAALGVTSVVVTSLMTATRVAHLASQIAEARRYGFTAKRRYRGEAREERSMAVVPTASRGVAGVSVMGRF